MTENPKSEIRNSSQKDTPLSPPVHGGSPNISAHANWGRSERRVKNIIRGSSVVLTALILLTLPDVPLTKPIREMFLPVTLIPIDPIELEKERKRPKPLPISAGVASSHSSPAPFLSPTETSAPPSEIVVAEPSMEQPEYGLISELFERPPEDRQPIRMEPVASPLPDILSERSNEGPSRPPAALPSAVAQRGENYRGAGSPNLEVATTPSYTGPDLNLPSSDIPTTGLTHGDLVSSSTVPGSARGDKYESTLGQSPGPNNSLEIGRGQDIIGESELSGLLAWLRRNRSTFPPVVQSYLETNAGDLCGVTSYAGWDIFIQFSEEEHQLKLFLTHGSSGILLADSDFRQRSQLFGMGRVTRDMAISAIEAMREKPSTERTAEFYDVFSGWLDSKGIAMGSRAAR